MKKVYHNKILQNQTKDKLLIRDVLLHYKKLGRHDLLWRKKITPYRVLVSEVMLQQTQVSRVTPKFISWIKVYPSLKALRASTLKDVLLLWQGLGYQRRAKALFSIASETYSLPKTFNQLIELPGIGEYTASAICAFAYNMFSHPVLETNIRTVLIEYFHQRGTSIHDKVLYEDLLRLETYKDVQHLGARNWYYALMDFGAFLKTKHISHNLKSIHHAKQTAYKGSLRELRAKTLFSIAHSKTLPEDERLEKVIEQLVKEKFIFRRNTKYYIQNF
jgi:A/G-specific adenine glycosylase